MVYTMIYFDSVKEMQVIRKNRLLDYMRMIRRNRGSVFQCE